MTKKKNYPEEGVQKAIVQYYNFLRKPQFILFAIPNDRGTRKKYEMGILKSKGVVPGAPDLAIIHDEGRIICVEVKAPGREGNLSENQKAWMVRCMELHTPYHVVSSVEDFEELLVKFDLISDSERKVTGGRREPIQGSLT